MTMQKVRELDFLIIGAMKSATSSLHKYLLEHNGIYLPPEKEAPFFSDDNRFDQGYSCYFKDFFRDASLDVLLGTVTPLYMMNPAVPQRIKDTCPNVKLIAILRDPIERAYSHYLMAVRIWGETRTFEEAMVNQLQKDRLTEARQNGSYWRNYIVFGEYGRILKEYFDLFPQEHIKIKYMDELVTTPYAFMSDLFDYLGLSNVTIRSLGKKFHDSKKKGFMPIVAHVALNTKLRLVGKYLLQGRMRRRIRFWLGLHRSHSGGDVDSAFRISSETQKKLQNLYLADVRSLSNLTRDSPYWIANWQRHGEH